MLDLIRNNRKTMLILLVLLVIPAFVFMGVSRGGGGGGPDELAEVSGTTITTSHLDDQIRRIQRSRSDLDPRLLERPDVKLEVLRSIIKDTLWMTASHANRLAVSDKALRDAIKLDANIQGMLDSNGNINMEQYREFLQYNGLQPNEFEEMTRSRVMTERMQVPTATGFTSQVDVDQLIQINDEKYVIRQQIFNADQYLDKVQVNAEELQTYYQQNQAIFMMPARADIEYIVFDAEAYAKTVKVSEEEARAFFEQNKDAFVVPEERRASHILVEVQAKVSAEQKEQARAKAQKLLAEVKNDPSRFAEIAKVNSDDPGSAAQGGDLGYFRPGMMVETFDNAAFTLKKGEVSDLVESPFGYHIITVTDIKPSGSPTFEEQRSKVEAQLHQQLVNQRFAQAAEKFSNDVFVQRSSFAGVAQEFGLTIQRAENITQVPEADTTGVLAHPEFMAAVFAPEARADQQNIAPVQISPIQLASARILSYTPEAVKPFEQVKEQIETLASQGRAIALAQAAAKEGLKLWQELPEKANAAKEIVFSRDDYAQSMQRSQLQELNVDPVVALEVFRYSTASQFPQTFFVDLPAKGAALVQVQRVGPADLSNSAKRLQATLVASSLYVGVEENAYLGFLEKKYKTKIFPQAQSLLGEGSE